MYTLTPGWFLLEFIYVCSSPVDSPLEEVKECLNSYPKKPATKAANKGITISQFKTSQKCILMSPP